MSDSASRLKKTESFLVYRNANVGLVMKYPVGWQKDEQSGPAGFMLGFFSPPENPQSKFRENVIFTVQPLFAPMKAEDYLRFSLRQVQQGPYEFEESSPATLADLPACQVLYTGPLSPMLPLAGKCFTLCAVSDTRGYGFCYTARAEKFDQYFQVIQEMVESVVIL
jgi:hypothetical protein